MKEQGQVSMPFASADILVNKEGKGALAMSFAGAGWLIHESLLSHTPDEVIGFLKETQEIMTKDINEFFNERIAAIDKNRDYIVEVVAKFKETDASFQNTMADIRKKLSSEGV